MSESYVPQDPTKLIGFLDELDQESRTSKDRYSTRWDANVAEYRGEQWHDKRNKPLFLSNIISPALERKAGLLTESKPAIDIKPRRNGFQIASDTLNSTIKAGWDEQNLELALESLAAYLQTFGNGIFRIMWDPGANYGIGDIVIEDIDPRLIRFDPVVMKSWQMGDPKYNQYIIEDSIVPLSWIQTTFPKTADQVAPDSRLIVAGAQDKKITGFRRSLILASGSRNAGESNYLNAIPRVYLRYYWIVDPATDARGVPLYPNGRRILRTGDDTILNPSSDPATGVYYSGNPYFDGLWPYEMIDSKPDLDHPWGRSEVESMRRLQEAFNSLGHTFVKNLIRNVPVWIADANAVTPETLNELKDIEEMVIEKSAGRSVDRIPANTQAGHLEMMRLCLMLVEILGGLNDGSMQGKGRVELRSGAQVEGLQQSAQVMVRAQARRLEKFLERVGKKWISRIFQFYTENRIMTYMDRDKSQTFEFEKDRLRNEIIQHATKALQEQQELKVKAAVEAGEPIEPQDLRTDLNEDEILLAIKGAWREFHFKIIPFSSLSTTKIQRSLLLKQLADQMMVPSSMVLKEAGFDNVDELLKQAVAEAKQKQAMGVPPMPPPKAKGKRG